MSASQIYKAKQELEKWSVEQIEDIFIANGFTSCCPVLRVYNVDGFNLMRVTDDNLTLWKNHIDPKIIGHFWSFVIELKRNPTKYIQTQDDEYIVMKPASVSTSRPLPSPNQQASNGSLSRHGNTRSVMRPQVPLPPSKSGNNVTGFRNALEKPQKQFPKQKLPEPVRPGRPALLEKTQSLPKHSNFPTNDTPSPKPIKQIPMNKSPNFGYQRKDIIPGRGANSILNKLQDMQMTQQLRNNFPKPTTDNCQSDDEGGHYEDLDIVPEMPVEQPKIDHPRNMVHAPKPNLYPKNGPSIRFKLPIAPIKHPESYDEQEPERYDEPEHVNNASCSDSFDSDSEDERIREKERAKRPLPPLPPSDETPVNSSRSPNLPKRLPPQPKIPSCLLPMPPSVSIPDKIINFPLPPEVPNEPRKLSKTTTLATPRKMSPTHNFGNVQEAWFWRNTDRTGSRRLLENLGDGAFLMHPSRKKEYYCTLTIMFKNRLYNIPVVKEGSGFVLGNYRDSDFKNVYEIVSYYTNSPLLLINNGTTYETTLRPLLTSDLR